MNHKSIDGTFNHDNDKGRECLDRLKRLMASCRHPRRRKHHQKVYLKWIHRTFKLGDKIMTGTIQ